MKHNIGAGLTIVAYLGLSAAGAAGQSWYEDRDARYAGQGWRSQVFLQVRSDLDHIWSAQGASEKERTRLERTKQELTELQAKLDGGQFDNGTLNDVIDSIQKSANDDRLAPRDRAVLSDDVNRLKDYQNNHNQWAQENHNQSPQDWYQDRDVRYAGQGWRSRVFLQVRSDLDHIWSAQGASEKERTRLERTKQELTELQAKLDGGQFDNGTLNDVIDSIQKSANDDRLAPRDRAVLSDDLNRLKDYQNNHNRWNK